MGKINKSKGRSSRKYSMTKSANHILKKVLNEVEINYKNFAEFSHIIFNGRIPAGIIKGFAKEKRKLANAIKIARLLGLLPYSTPATS